MQAVAHHSYTEDEYCALEETSLTRHEYFNGKIWNMAGGSPAHAIVAANVIRRLGNQLDGKPCVFVGSVQRLKVEATGLITYPDVMVYCQPFRCTTQ